MIKRFFSILILGGFLLLIPALVWAAEEKPTIELWDEAWIAGSDVFLDDIADISGDAELVEELGRVNTGRAPVTGSSRRLTKGHIEVRMRQAGIDPNLVQFTGSTEVTVYKGSPTQRNSADQTYQVVVVTRDVSRGDVLTEEDLQVEAKEVRGSTWDQGEIADFVGKRAVRSVSAGSVLTPSAVEVVPAIERGDQVWIITQIGTVQAMASGVARSSGGLGDIIPVENSSSRKVVYGEITDSDTVIVNVRGSSAR